MKKILIALSLFFYCFLCHADGFSIKVEGNKLINANGFTVQLRGANYSGYEFADIEGFGADDPSGAQDGQANGPNLASMMSWNLNSLRIPLNEASWLGYTCRDTDKKFHNPDPKNNYQSSVISLVNTATTMGFYVIVDLHWAAPGNYCPMLQTQMADADHSLDFWSSVATVFKNNPAVIFELYNEPFFDFDFSGDSWSSMMNCTNGSFSGFPATSGSGNWKNIKKQWKVACYQSMIDVVRQTGATNVLLIGNMEYSQDLSNWLAYKPNDPLNQMGAAWHPYRLYQSAYDYPYPNYYPEVMTDAENILNSGIPLVMTEIGGQNTDGTPSCPICDTMTNYADTYGAGVLGWGWDLWGDPENVLVKDADGTPTDGYGISYYNWTKNHK